MPHFWAHSVCQAASSAILRRRWGSTSAATSTPSSPALDSGTRTATARGGGSPGYPLPVVQVVQVVLGRARVPGGELGQRPLGLLVLPLQRRPFQRCRE